MELLIRGNPLRQMFEVTTKDHPHQHLAIYVQHLLRKFDKDKMTDDKKMLEERKKETQSILKFLKGISTGNIASPRVR